MDYLVDWEQRRYEIATKMLATIYLDEGQEQRSRQRGMFEYQDMQSCAHEAVRWADVLIDELKKPREK
jgi:hypothetical protein